MLTGPTADNLIAAVASACRSGLDAYALRAAVVPRLRKAVPIDARWWASADPATLLFTRSYREELPEASGPYFVENEFLRKDVNKWTELAREPAGVGTLMQATGGRPASSDRYRDIFAPLQSLLRSRHDHRHPQPSRLLTGPCAGLTSCRHPPSHPAVQQTHQSVLASWTARPVRVSANNPSTLFRRSMTASLRIKTSSTHRIQVACMRHPSTTVR